MSTDPRTRSWNLPPLVRNGQRYCHQQICNYKYTGVIAILIESAAPLTILGIIAAILQYLTGSQFRSSPGYYVCRYLFDGFLQCRLSPGYGLPSGRQGLVSWAGTFKVTPSTSLPQEWIGQSVQSCTRIPTTCGITLEGRSGFLFNGRLGSLIHDPMHQLPK
jgi:hypothetical protein